jgi:hypothetical protein
MPPGGPLLIALIAAYYAPFVAVGIAASFVVARALLRRNGNEPDGWIWRLSAVEFLAFYTAFTAAVLTGGGISIYVLTFVLGGVALGLLLFSDIALASRCVYACVTITAFLAPLWALGAAQLMYPLF